MESYINKQLIAILKCLKIILYVIFDRKSAHEDMHSSVRRPLVPKPFPLSSGTGRPILDYGNNAKLRTPNKMNFSITNQSAISTTLEVNIANFTCKKEMHSSSQCKLN